MNIETVFACSNPAIPPVHNDHEDFPSWGNFSAGRTKSPKNSSLCPLCVSTKWYRQEDFKTSKTSFSWNLECILAFKKGDYGWIWLLMTGTNWWNDVSKLNSVFTAAPDCCFETVEEKYEPIHSGVGNSQKQPGTTALCLGCELIKNTWIHKQEEIMSVSIISLWHKGDIYKMKIKQNSIILQTKI